MICASVSRSLYEGELGCARLTPVIDSLGRGGLVHGRHSERRVSRQPQNRLVDDHRPREHRRTGFRSGERRLAAVRLRAKRRRADDDVEQQNAHVRPLRQGDRHGGIHVTPNLKTLDRIAGASESTCAVSRRHRLPERGRAEVGLVFRPMCPPSSGSCDPMGMSIDRRRSPSRGDASRGSGSEAKARPADSARRRCVEHR